MTTHEYVTGQHRLAGYHRMGIEMDPGTNLSDAMLEARLLGWNLRLSPLVTFVGGDGDGDDLDIVGVPGRYANVADDPHNPGDHIVVGSGMTDGFVNVSNEEVAAFTAEVVHGSPKELIVDAAGSYMGGSRCFITLRRPDTITIGGDEIVPYMFAHWGHDGGTTITLQPQYIRPWCTNMIRGMLGDATAPKFKVRHTGSTIEGKVQQAREALQIMAKGESEFEKAVQEWTSKTVTDVTFDKIVEGLLPGLEEDASAGAVTRRRDQQELYREIYNHDPARRTAWGALNAWTEMGDWYGNFANEENLALAQVTSPQLEARRIRGARTIAELVPGRALAHVG